MTFRTTLVNRPKKPFQSPGTHQSGLNGVLRASGGACGGLGCHGALLCQAGRGQVRAGSRRREAATQPKMPPCALIIARPVGLEFGEVGAGAIRQHQAVEAAIVRFAHRRVDADLGGDAADDQLRDAAAAQHRLEVGGVERALAGLVDHRLAGGGGEFGDDVVAGLAAHQDAAHRAGIADAAGELAARAALPAAGRKGRADGLRGYGSPASRPRGRRAARRLSARWRRAAWLTSLPSMAPKPPGSRKSRCMSMMSSAAAAGHKSKA